MALLKARVFSIACVLPGISYGYGLETFGRVDRVVGSSENGGEKLRLLMDLLEKLRLVPRYLQRPFICTTLILSQNRSDNVLTPRTVHAGSLSAEQTQRTSIV